MRRLKRVLASIAMLIMAISANAWPWLSPYAYCMNNPVKFVDPDGKQIFLVGNHNVQMSLLKQLQSLTNDKLGMNRKTGEVTIMKTGIRNVEKNLPVGTSLISSLVNTGKQVDIQTNSENRFHEWEYDHQKEKSYNGEGADCTVSVDLNGNRDVMVKDNKTGEIHNEKIQLNIVLGHELVHAFRSTNGEASKDAKTEELTTTGLKGDYYYTENNLRKEQGLNMRVKY